MSQGHSYINAEPDVALEFFRRTINGPLTMLHLLKFREVADYSRNPELSEAKSRTGLQAFETFLQLALPLLRATGGDLVFYGNAFPYLIGPQTEKWNKAMILRQSSLESLSALAANPDFTHILGHRTAALADCRLLPLQSTLFA